MISTKDMEQFLDGSSYCKQPFHIIAKNHNNIKSEIEAYDYDEIKTKLVGQKCESFKLELFKNTLLIYGKEAKDGKKLFYDRVDVWYDYEFERKIKELA